MKMEKEKTTVRFANKEMEDDFNRLGESEHPEDRRLHAVLRRVRETVLREYQKGRRVPESAMVKMSRDLFGIHDLWSLEIPGHGTVFFGVFENEILIVDHIEALGDSKSLADEKSPGV